MSKLKKAIERAGRRETGSIGFGQAMKARRRALLLAVVAKDAKAAGKAAEAGADVIVLDGRQTGEVKAAVASAGDAVVGAQVPDLNVKLAGELAEAGADFIVSPFGSTAATAVNLNRCGHVISLMGDVDDTTLRALGPIGLDALLAEAPASEPTLEQQARFVRLAQLTSTQLIFQVEARTDVDELRVLRDSGGAVVLLPEGTSAGDITTMGKRLEAVPEPHRRDIGTQNVAVLPALLGGGHDHEDEPEDPGEE